MSAQGPPTPVDAHVHLHDERFVGASFDAALRHFRSAAPAADPAGVLLLSEAGATDAFGWLYRGDGCHEQSEWQLTPTAERISLLARRRTGEAVVIVRGRQVVTRERLELLLLGAEEWIPDGLHFEKALSWAAGQEGVLVVVPWGFGKWWGARGGMVKRALDRYGSRISLGDNGGRPTHLPEPPLFQYGRDRGVQVLPGSDPLPLPFESHRAGSYGFLCDTIIELAEPFQSIKRFLKASIDGPRPYGKRSSLAQFVRSQVGIRVRH